MSKPAPHELETIRHIYLTVVDEPWFNRNAITERELLKLVLRACTGSDKSRSELEGLCRTEARARFSRLD